MFPEMATFGPLITGFRFIIKSHNDNNQSIDQAIIIINIFFIFFRVFVYSKCLRIHRKEYLVRGSSVKVSSTHFSYLLFAFL